MFNLEDSIRDWRKALSSEEACGASDLEELELHLREEIATLTETGLSGSEAFMVASRRLGAVRPLMQEFAKVNANAVFRKRLLWMSIGILGYMLAKYCSTGLAQGLGLLGIHAGLRAYSLGLLIESTRLVLLFAGILTMTYFLKRHSSLPALPQWLEPLRNKVLLLLGVALVDIALFLGPILYNVLAMRQVRAEELGKAALVGSYVNFFLPIVASFVLVILVIKLSPVVRREAIS